MLRKHDPPRPRRGPLRRRPFPADHLSYANVIASAALFVALGGTGVAAVTLDRDSVGAPQIRSDAVRSSEIRDASIRAADIATRARTALRGELKGADDENADHLTVPTCDGSDLSACPNRLELALANPRPRAPEAGRNWLIQARLHVSIDGTRVAKRPSGVANRCGLVDTSATVGPKAVLDETQVGDTARASSETVALSGVVPQRLRNPSVALRCTSQSGDRVTASFIKITALTVGTVTGAPPVALAPPPRGGSSPLARGTVQRITER
jgi:hypothetical protein